MSVQEVLRPGVRDQVDSRRFVGGILIGMAILQALWIVTVPPFRASDEFDHVYRAAAVARGQWRATEAPEDGRGTLVRVPGDIVSAAHDQCAALPYTGHDNCNPARRDDDGMVYVGSGAGAYNPVFYWVVGTAARPFHGAGALYAMRIASALICLIFIGLAAWALARGRPGTWSGPGLLLAISPVFLFSTSVAAAPNGLEMSAALALWCLLLRAPDVDDLATQRRMLTLAGVAAAVVVTLRMLGPLFVVLIVALALVYHGRTAWSFVSRHRRHTVTVATLVCGATAAAAAWTLNAGLVQGSGEQGTEDWSPGSILLWPLQTIAAFPYRNQPGPLFVYPLVGVLVCGFAFVALRTARGNRRLALALALVAALALPFVLTWVSREGRGVMWQGRYGLPLAVGFIVIAGLVLDGALRRPSRWLIMAGGAGLAASTAACLIKVVHDELGHAASSGDGAWLAPPTWIIVALTVVGFAALVAAVSAHSEQPGPAT